MSTRDDWMRHGACQGHDPETWFPAGNTGPALLQITEAKAICARCPVAAECLEWALDHRENAGIWGGATEEERRTQQGTKAAHSDAAIRRREDIAA